MNKKLSIFILVLAPLLISPGCGILNPSKIKLTDGLYKTKTPHEPKQNVYLVVKEDTITSYKAIKVNKTYVADTGSYNRITFSDYKKHKLQPYYFSLTTFDFDVITIPLKYRFPVKEFPQQLITDYNGSLYIGCRTDIYHVSYEESPLKIYKRDVDHFAFTCGGFVGLDACNIKPWTMGNKIDIEYTGACIEYGIAALIGIQELTFGIAVGMDYLADRNHSYWIYQNKPWLGLALGLNIN